MIDIVAISLENEMDLVLAHKRSMKVAERLGVTIATQTTFATAVSEIARAVIEHTDKGLLKIGLEQNKQRYSLMAIVLFDPDVRFTNADAGFYYAQRLVPEFVMNETAESNEIIMKLGLSRSLKLDPIKIQALKKYFIEDGPLNAYEEIKQRNENLYRLAEAREEEIRQSKLIDEKKTEFISVASHEIKTPMTVLKAFTQMAKMTKEPISDHLRGLLDKVDTQSTKLLSLVQQLLDVSRMEHGNLQYTMEKLPFHQFMNSCIELMKNILPYHQFEWTFSEEVMVMADRLRLEQVLSNLLNNAAKYSEKNTKITIHSKVTDGFVRVTVTDQGKGMSSETTGFIFDRFYRAEDVVHTHSGLGMGLYITSKIITDHGGRIWVESQEGKGSAFHFSIPTIH